MYVQVFAEVMVATSIEKENRLLFTVLAPEAHGILCASI